MTQPSPSSSTLVPQPTSLPASSEVVERPAWAVSGWFGVGLIVVGTAVIVRAAVALSRTDGSARSVLWLAAILLTAVLVVALAAASLVVIQPVETRVVQFLGRYVGTVRRNGFVLLAPLTNRRRVSVRVNNFETRIIKVNDAEGNPIELAAIVVWQVADTARSVFSVADHIGFVTVQAEAALRHVATTHPYDDAGGTGTSLRGSTDLVAAELAGEVAARVEVAGIQILEVRISHLAYSPEIAQAMLQRQQASAIIAARSRIVDGAVGMVEMALARLRENEVVELDEERKAAMVSNLLVVLCGDSRATPVVNTGTLYQ
jgi:regulator of protease activity HflC (stomatin/prohibitin superfamily)